MKNNWIYTDKQYRPYLNDSDDYDETPDLYYNRIQTLLPNFPREIVIQWFYRHWGQIDDYAWLEYESLTFKKVIWTAEKIINSGIKEKSTIQIDHQRYEDKHHYPRQQQIVDYFDLKGTWPIAPIFLKNIDGKIIFPNGRQCIKPYHLLEGHNRAAIFWSYYERNKVKTEHIVWIVNAKEV